MKTVDRVKASGQKLQVLYLENKKCKTKEINGRKLKMGIISTQKKHNQMGVIT